MATIPGNILQLNQQNQMKMMKRPSFGMRGHRRATIIKVYDRDTLDDSEIPGELARALATKPGRIYGQVKLTTGETLYLAFALSPELIYTIFGDSKLIEGRAANVVFYDRNVHAGEIEILPEEKKALRNTKDSTDIFDIGSIFG
jgi:hypothetical protein